VIIIDVTNRKGGVGKSTVSVHLAAGLATHGYSIGLVDTDSQGHAGLMLGMPESDGLFDLLINKRPLANCILPVPSEQFSTADIPAQGALYMVPSSVHTYKIPHMLNADESFLFLQKMEEFGNAYSLDAIIVDTAPTMSLFDGSIYLAADAYIYVTEAERMSLDGVVTAVDQMQRFNQQRKQYLGRESSILGIVPNKMRSTLVHKHNLDALVDQFGDLVWPSLGLRTLWTEASNLNQTVFTYAPSGQEAKDAWAVVKKTEQALWPSTEKQR
jgi:chromosome partitioning protein